ncbi:MAG: hypothetical protein UU05_C0028G0003 [Candidatus Curtissbacteria bacterium GW2011_GWA1_40_47]|uniref:Uncharacterized protein n=1 Tax=Candidatus Curtissbacteria bacterium RIFOXYA1_FULL_41_14 TaxID=1797737 RepID=A0A1F5HC42_9BACT|nr:MAG: hypothetical protein UT95_C0032G0004 [Candidatus Curtissbacteria bacterium GW2011_GWB1_40_28]KKR60654.1 MAG: hypothetical protein UT99_C0010G0019 [Candidatus Curtissbacteria bacterium GW2011_GWA2_40_31]KKR61685.1 MAG: hypothetical protein UU00_C0009G0007 [Microgenomates group bacterium GW2011_GWC1_40_35]KKR65107.1 MAG: hypothetical protein UU05_C0028G0003 [Candidatus Curtissbacteria bacterium GW2011_GWA1_40_47]KKS01046.1 MAG: hypothetical protein UU53_C0020G0007 [Candidatus Curtissbacte
MPFKTRRAKISAASRRFIIVKEQVFDYLGKEAKTESEKKLSSSNVKQGVGIRTIESNYNYVKGDLVKIILLTSLIISAQITLLFFLRYH